MVFWIVTAVITAAVAAALIAPLFRNRGIVGESDSEVAIYRDQLAEIERDVERGVLPESEAESARTEIARRLLRASEEEAAAAPASDSRRQGALWIAILVLPAVGLAGYLAFGEPGAEDRPFDERIASPDPDDLYVQLERLGLESTPEEIAAVAETIERGLEIEPDDPTLLRLATQMRIIDGRLEDAASTYIRLLEGLGDPNVADEGGQVGTQLGFELAFLQPEIGAAGEELIRLVFDRFPRNEIAQLNYAELLIRLEDEAAAADVLEGLVATAPPEGSPIVDIARSRLAELRGEGAGGLTPEQLEFVDQMVGQLAARLEAEPDDAEGWAQLITSYMVLGREEDARAALGTAREFFTGNDEALAIIEEAAAPLVEQE